MSRPSAEHRAKIAASMRLYFEQHPEARQRSVEAGRRGAEKTNALIAADKAEAVELRDAFLALRMECDQLHAELVATRNSLAKANAALEEARAEVARLMERLA